jgi:hypothetical protein
MPNTIQLAIIQEHDMILKWKTVCCNVLQSYKLLAYEGGWRGYIVVFVNQKIVLPSEK